MTLDRTKLSLYETMGYSSVLRFSSVAVEVAMTYLNLLLYTHADLLWQNKKNQKYISRQK